VASATSSSAADQFYVASKAIGRPFGAAIFLSGLISGRSAVNLRPMKTGIILINRCIITC